MSKVKSNKTIIGVLVSIFMFASILLSGCTGSRAVEWLAVIQERDFVNRIVYTDNPSKYTSGKIELDLEQLIADVEAGKPPVSEAITIVQDPDTQMVDIVIDSSLNGELGQFGLGVDGVAYGMKYEQSKDLSRYGALVALDCSHIFSGTYGCYVSGGKGRCSGDPECTNFIYDYMDHDVCNAHGEGTLYFEGDGTYQKPHLQWIKVQTESAPKINRELGMEASFKELVIDGFDFGVYYDLITNYDYLGNHYPNYQSVHNPNNFKNMFSDLPVSKITISNVKGLAGRVDDMSGMFENCTNLKTVEFGNLFDGVKPTNISRMFYNCPRLTNVDLSSLDTSRVTDMSEMFDVITITERNNMINDYINNVFIPAFNSDGKYDVTKEYDLESFTTELNTILGESLTKEQVLMQYLRWYTLCVPITCDEFAKLMFGATWDEFVELVKTNPDEIGLPAKTDGTQYTENELCDIMIQVSGFPILTDELFADSKIITNVPAGKLVFGGNDSKFVINSGVNTSSMFGNNYNFGVIVTPKQIADDVQITLIDNYTDGKEYKTSTIGAADANQCMFYHVNDYDYEHLIKENEITPPATITTPTNNNGGLGDTLKTALIMAGSAVAVVVGTVVVTFVTKRKR